MSTLSMRKFRISLFAAVLALFAFSPALHAQNPQLIGRFDVPFAFDTGYRHYTPGTYIVELQSTNLISIVGPSGSSFAMMTPNEDVKPSTTTRLVFWKFGDRYLLSEVRSAGNSVYMERIPSKAEKHEQIAKNATAPGSVEIALLRTTH